MWKVATRNEWDEQLQYYNKENQDDNVEKENWDRKLNDTDANDDGENMPQRTSPHA